jgi:DUF971 family protein
MNDNIRVKALKLHQKSHYLAVIFENDDTANLSCEYLRVFSPSAEVQGHGQGTSKLEYGKKDVNIIAIEPVGNYAVKLIFTDGHATGIYSWQTLHSLAINHDENWHKYITALATAGLSREPEIPESFRQITCRPSPPLPWKQHQKKEGV